MAGFWGAIKKVSTNTLSSAAGTATVLGVHSAFMPSDNTPKVMDSQLFNPTFETFETNKSLFDLHLGESGTFFAISVSCLALALVGLCAASYCGCSPSARRARRERAEYNRLRREGRERLLLHSQEMQEMEEATERLSKLNVLHEKRKLEYPSSADGGPVGIVSTLGEAINVSSSSEASTSAIEMTGRESGREVTRTNQDRLGSNSNSIPNPNNY